MTQPPPMDDSELRAFGYAPGNYMTKCTDCGSTSWHADKRALRCRPCAIAAWNSRAALNAPPANQILENASVSEASELLNPTPKDGGAA